MKKHKHQLLVEISFEIPLTEKEAAQALQRFFDFGGWGRKGFARPIVKAFSRVEKYFEPFTE